MSLNASQYRWCELFLIFFCLPTLAYVFRDYLANWLFPALIILMIICSFLLLNDPHFKRFRLTSLGQFSTIKRRLFTTFLSGALFSAMLYGLFNQDNWFAFPLIPPLNGCTCWLLTLYCRCSHRSSYSGATSSIATNAFCQKKAHASYSVQLCLHWPIASTITGLLSLYHSQEVYCFHTLMPIVAP